MPSMEWIVVGVLVAVSAFYTVWRLLPRKRGGGGGCKACSAQQKTPIK